MKNIEKELADEVGLRQTFLCPFPNGGFDMHGGFDMEAGPEPLEGATLQELIDHKKYLRAWWNWRLHLLRRIYETTDRWTRKEFKERERYLLNRKRRELDLADLRIKTHRRARP